MREKLILPLLGASVYGSYYPGGHYGGELKKVEGPGMFAVLSNDFYLNESHDICFTFRDFEPVEESADLEADHHLKINFVPKYSSSYRKWDSSLTKEDRQRLQREMDARYLFERSYTTAELFELNDVETCFEMGAEYFDDVTTYSLGFTLERPDLPEEETIFAEPEALESNDLVEEITPPEISIAYYDGPPMPKPNQPKNRHIKMEAEISVKHSPIAVFIVTDKPVYLPEQKIQYKIALVDRFLKPVSSENFPGLKSISIVNPEDLTLQNIKNADDLILNQYGQINGEFQLLKEPTLGNWKIQVELHQYQEGYGLTTEYSADFKVDKYVLPKFEVTIEPAEESIYLEANTVSYKVCAAYTHGNKFLGQVNYQLSLTEENCDLRWDYKPSKDDDYDPYGDDYLDMYDEKSDTPKSDKGGKGGNLVPKIISNDQPLDLQDGCVDIEIQSLYDSLTKNAKISAGQRCNDWSYSPQKLSLNVTVIEQGTNEERFENDDSVTLNNELYEITTDQWQYIEDQPEFTMVATVKNKLTGLPAENVEILLHGSVSKWIFDQRYNKNLDVLLDEVKQASKPYCYKECEFGDESVFKKTNSNGQITYNMKFEKLESKWNAGKYDRKTDKYIANATKMVFWIGVFDHKNDMKYGMTAIAAPAATVVAPPKDVTDDDQPSQSATVSCGEETTISLAQELENADNLFYSLKINGKSQPIELIGNQLVVANLNIQIFDKKTKFNFLAYSVNPETNQVQSVLNLKDENIQLAENCYLTIELDMPETAKPAGVIDINLNFSQQVDAQCSINLVDDSIGIYAKQHNLKFNEITQEIIQEQIYDKLSEQSRYNSCSSKLPNGYQEVSSLVECDSRFMPYYDYDGDYMYDGAPMEVMAMDDGGSNAEIADYSYSAEEDDFSSNTSTFSMNKEVSKPKTGPKKIRVRNFMPETWMFQDFTSQNLANVVVPDTITSWSAQVFCLSSEVPLSLAAPQKITVSKYFFTELKTPFAATRSEVIKIPVQIFNAGDTDEETILEISNNEDDLILIDSDTRQFMLPANDIHVEWFKFRVAGIGPTKVRSTAFAIYDSNNKSDAMEKTIKLKAEGIAKQVSYTSYKCTTGAEKSFHEILSAPPAGTQNLVPDSVRNKLSITDNLFGNAFDNLDNLVTVPSGCGEQNMVGVVPNIAVANFLADPEDPTRISAIEKAQYGYERELKYQRKDGSFSAFGDSDKEGSTWLTAFVIRSFVEGADFLTIDYENVMKPALRYLLDSGVQKDKTLMFPNTGRLFHGFYNEDSVKGIFKDMHMTVTGILAIERVLEKNVLPEMKTELKNAKTMAWNWIQKAKEENCQGVSNCNWENGANINIYTLGHILYAASVSGKTTLVNKIKYYFKQNQEYENYTIYWKANSEPCEGYWACYYKASNNVELTSYYLLATLNSNQLTRRDTQIMRYLQSQRNDRGGWPSTQDTMMAMTALAKFSQLSTVRGNIDFTINYELNGQASSININENNKGYYKQVESGINNQFSKIKLSGRGCALVQNTVYYNIQEIAEDENLSLTFEAATDTYCVQRLNGAKATLMAVVEINLPTGHTVNEYSMTALLENNENSGVLRIDDNTDNVSVYLDKIDATERCFSLALNVNEVIVENQQKRSVVVYDYYDTSVRKSITV